VARRPSSLSDLRRLLPVIIPLFFATKDSSCTLTQDSSRLRTIKASGEDDDFFQDYLPPSTAHTPYDSALDLGHPGLYTSSPCVTNLVARLVL